MTFASQIAAVVNRSCPPLEIVVLHRDQCTHENADGDDVPEHDRAEEDERGGSRRRESQPPRAEPQVETEHGAGNARARATTTTEARSAPSPLRQLTRARATSVRHRDDRRRCGLATRFVPRLVLAGGASGCF